MNYYIVLRSVTHATWLKRMFDGYKDKVALIHTPHKIPSGGCSYALQTYEVNLPMIMQKASEHGLKIIGVFKKLDNNEFEEVKL